MKSLTVTIPATPRQALSPNARCHWGAKNRARDDIKNAVFFTLKAAINLESPEDCFMGQPKPLTLNWTIYWEKRRRTMDHDNSIAILKYPADAVAEAIGMDDKHFRVGTVEQARDPEGKGYMVLTITAGADA